MVGYCSLAIHTHRDAPGCTAYRRRVQGHWGAPPTVALVVPSGKRVPDPSEELLTAFVHLDHGAKFSPAQAGHPQMALCFPTCALACLLIRVRACAGHGCPLLHVPRATGASMPIVGFCEMTPDNRDCHVGDMGAWGTQIKGATITGPRWAAELSPPSKSKINRALAVCHASLCRPRCVTGARDGCT